MLRGLELWGGSGAGREVNQQWLPIDSATPARRDLRRNPKEGLESAWVGERIHAGGVAFSSSMGTEAPAHGALPVLALYLFIWVLYPDLYNQPVNVFPSIL